VYVIDCILLQRHGSTVACSKFVPNSKPADGLEIRRLQSLLNAAKCLMVITGAGISTESGIPGIKWCLSVVVFGTIINYFNLHYECKW